MLPSDLLRVKISRGRISPVFASLDSDSLALAQSLVDIYRGALGRKKGELMERLRAVENQGHDFKLVRGLSALLERSCVFEADSGGMDPVEARRAVFREASRRRSSSAGEREKVLEVVSTGLRVSPEALEKALFSDVEDELFLRSFEAPDPKALLRSYNLSVTQTLLFKALRVEFSASGNWKNIFRDVKWLGLIYSVERPAAVGGAGEKEGGGAQGRFTVSLDGPLSLFKMTERYGTAIAKLLPQIAASESWSIKAEILARSRGGKVYSFEMDSEEAKGLIAGVGADGVGREWKQSRTYDSTTEANFARAFLSFATGWKLRREPEPLVAGTHVLIPDFVFEKDGMKVYLEVVGFWTPEYLERKIAKLGSVSGVDMIVAADESLACSRLQRLSGKARVIYYKRDVPLKPIVEHLREREGSVLREQVERLRVEGGAGGFSFQGDVVSVEDVANARGVSPASMKAAIEGFAPEGYMRVGDRLFVSRPKLQEIDRKLEGVGTLGEALAVIEACGVKEEGGKVLEALGYTSVWDGLEMDKVKISKNPVSAAGQATVATTNPNPENG